MTNQISKDSEPMKIPGLEDTQAPAATGAAPSTEEVVNQKADGKSQQDVLERAQSAKETKSELLRDFGSPQAPLPNALGRQRLALLNQIKAVGTLYQINQQMISQEGVVAPQETDLSRQVGAPADPQINSNMQFLSIPNYMGALYAALQIYRENLIKTKEQESENRIQVRQNMYDAGMDAAEATKDATLKQAAKEKYDAWKNAASGCLSAYQAKSQLAAGAQEKARVTAEMDKEIGAQKQVVENLKNQGVAASDPNAGDHSQKVLEAEVKLRQMESSRSQRAADATRERTTIIDLQYRSINSFTEAGFSVLRSEVTTQEAELQKIKAMLDTLIQSWSKTEDTISRSKEEAASEMQKMDQLITELSKAARNYRG